MRKNAMHRFLIIPFFSIFLSACAANPSVKMMGIPTTSIQTDRSINVLGAKFNGEHANESGGETCCVRVPQQWSPGLTAEIEWTIDPYPKGHPDDGKEPIPFINGVTNPEWRVWYQKHRLRETTHSKIIPLPKYKDSCGVTFIFLPCNDVTAVIDCEQKQALKKNLPGGDAWEKEIVRRLGGSWTCQK
jgi:hypothetical protein